MLEAESRRDTRPPNVAVALLSRLTEFPDLGDQIVSTVNQFLDLPADGTSIVGMDYEDQEDWNERVNVLYDLLTISESIRSEMLPVILDHIVASSDNFIYGSRSANHL